MKFKVITINDQADSFVDFTSSATAAGLAFETHQATDARTLDKDDPFFDLYPRKFAGLSKGAVGCSRAHLDLYAQCVADNEPYLICEDDARFVAGFDLATYDVLDNDLLFLSVSGTTDVDLDPIPTYLPYNRRYIIPNTCGYIITPKGAAIALRAATVGGTLPETLRKTIDFQLMAWSDLLLNAAVYNPQPIAHSGAESSIATDDYFIAPPAPILMTPRVPKTVESWKLKIVIAGAGQTAAIDAAIDALPEAYKVPTRIGWDNAAFVDRDNAFLSNFIADPSNGVDDATADAWFIATKNI